MAEPLKSSRGSLFVQLTPGKTPEYIGCLDLDAIAEPLGDQALIRCRDGNGDRMVVGSTQDAPGNVTTSITALVFPNSDILDRVSRCLVNLYALQSSCGKLGVFTNWDRMAIVHHAKLTNRSLQNLVMREEDQPSTRVLDFSAWNPVYNLREVNVSRQTIAETTDLNAIVMCNGAQCAGDCGENQDACTEGFLGGDAPTGSPTDRADIWQTDDGGLAWTNLTGAAAHPFVAAQDVKAVGCVQLDASTTRWFAARGSVGSEPLKIAYSDDSGATWTLVTLGATNGEAAAGPGALFIRDRDNLYLATSSGNVYFSADAGVTWTAQSGALTASGGASLNVVKFSDADNGYAAGNSDVLIRTTDGGATWADVSVPTSSDNIIALHVFSPFRVIIGTNDGKIYQTWDTGANWEAKTYSGQAATNTIQKLEFVNDLTGFAIINTTAPVGSVHRSVDGGHTWQKLTTPTNAGLNDLYVCDENSGYVVGNAQGGTGFVAKIA